MAVKAAVEKVVEVVEKAVESAAGIVEVQLVEEGKAVYTAFTSKGIVNFENGVAKVADEIAQELKSIGLIK